MFWDVIRFLSWGWDQLNFWAVAFALALTIYGGVLCAIDARKKKRP